jgi:hypothetical protein
MIGKFEPKKDGMDNLGNYAKIKVIYNEILESTMEWTCSQHGVDKYILKVFDQNTSWRMVTWKTEKEWGTTLRTNVENIILKK